MENLNLEDTNLFSSNDGIVRKLHCREANPLDFPRIIKIMGPYYLLHSLHDSNPGRSPMDLEGPPWTCYGNRALYWMLGEIDSEIVAFMLSRRVKRNWHLHGLFVDSNFQSRGIGCQLLFRHWTQGLRENPTVDTFTVHVHHDNALAYKFYERWGYREVDQLTIDSKEDSGLGDWVRNCKSCGDWPLRKDLLLYIIRVKDLPTW